MFSTDRQRLYHILCALLIATLVLGLAACSGPTEEPGEPPAEEEPAEPEEGGTVVMGFPSEPTGFNPLLWESSYNQFIHSLVFNSLVKANKELEMEPDLATGWEFSDDGRTVTFTLRDDVKWHDGQPFTARDVVFTFESLANPKYDGGQFARVERVVGAKQVREGATDSIEGIEVMDDHTISFTTEEPYAPFLIDILMTRIVPEHVLGDVSPEEWTRHEFNTDAPIGTGPMKLARYDRGSSMEFAPYEEYYEGNPKLDRFILRFGDQNTLMAAFMNREIDMFQVPISEAETVEEAPFAEVKEYDNIGYQYLGLNLRNEILGDIVVRQAVAHAVNKEQIVRSLLRGHGEPVDIPFPRNVWAYPDDLEGYEYNLDRAKELLDEAGWIYDEAAQARKKGDQVMEFELIYPVSDLLRAQTAPIIQHNLTALGMKVELRALDFPTLVTRIIPRDSRGNLRAVTVDDFDMYLLGMNAKPGDPIIVRRFYHSQYQPPNGHNYIGYANERVDQLWDESDRTVDFNRRKELVHEMMRIMAQDPPVIALYADKALWAYNTRVQDFDPGPNGVTTNIHEWYVK